MVPPPSRQEPDMRNLLSALLITVISMSAHAENAPQPTDAAKAIMQRSLVSSGDRARLWRVLAKAKRGEALVVGMIGGSITEGAGASGERTRWASRVAEWWRDTFPKSEVTFVNAGIGATGSNIGSHRVGQHLLVKKPDFVVAEFAVNDPNTQDAAETLEGLVRQIMAQPNQPALMLLFTMHNNGTNAQEWHGKVGQHYGLPMVSFRDAIWPEIQAERLKWEDVEADIVHPNDRGHEYCAAFITNFLADSLGRLPNDAAAAKIPDLPRPLWTDIYEHTALLTADTLKPKGNKGWKPSKSARFGPCWETDTPGSALGFEFEGTALHLVFSRERSNTGMIEVVVDDRPSVTVNGWHEHNWGPYPACERIADKLPPGKHRVSITLSKEKSPQSTGHYFQLQCLLIGGVPARR
jgi:lysophospholipase L1-like esterase